MVTAHIARKRNLGSPDDEAADWTKEKHHSIRSQNKSPTSPAGQWIETNMIALKKNSQTATKSNQLKQEDI